MIVSTVRALRLTRRAGDRWSTHGGNSFFDRRVCQIIPSRRRGETTTNIAPALALWTNQDSSFHSGFRGDFLREYSTSANHSFENLTEKRFATQSEPFISSAPSKMKHTLEELSSRYQQFSNLVGISSVKILPQGSLQVTQRQDSLTQEMTQKFTQSFVPQNGTFVPAGFPSPLDKDIKAIQYSPSRTLMAVVRQKDDKPGVIEIWNRQLINVIEMKHCGSHDKAESICTDSFFGGFQWDASERYLIFTTKRNPSKTSEPLYAPSTSNKDDSSANRGRQYVFEESWGDSRDDLYYTSLWVADVKSQSSVQVRKVPDIPEDLIPAHPVWTPGARGALFVGQRRYHRRMGHIYCSNRSSGIYHVQFDAAALFSEEGTGKAQLDLITQNCKEDYAATFPSFSPDGKQLVYFTAASTFAHSGCSLVRTMDWNLDSDQPASQGKTVLGPNSSQDPSSIGLYNREPAQNVWLDHETIVLSSFIRSKGVLLQINVISKKVDVFTLGQEFQDGTYEIFDIWNKKMVISYETPTQLPQYYVIDGDNKTPLQHDAPEEVEKLLEGQQWKFIDVQSTQDSGKCEAILISPPGEGPAPMIAYPHGGPHSNTPSMFVGLFGYFVSLGYHVLLVNYRGSLGFGQDELEGLCGRSGFRDVQDVKDAIEEACKLDTVDGDRVIIAGGSHGGFITGHLIGQYPGRFKAAVMRNPVTNIASMVSGTDIPDWCVAEACGSDKPEGFPGEDGIWQGEGVAEGGACMTEEKLLRMHRASPMAHIHNVVTPTIVVLGLKDRRVPNYQGKEFYYHLKGRQVPCEIFAYEDPHAITQVHFAYDAWMHISLFLERHLE